MPDLRETFIRGLNVFYQNNNGAADINANQLDPDSNRQPGKFQNDATRLPNNKLQVKVGADGKHEHNIAAITGGSAINHGTRTTQIVTLGDDVHKRFTIKLKSEDHTPPTTIQGGDLETRPKNIALYYYVKIN